MQDTRLNTLVSRALSGLAAWLQNPWRRWSVMAIALLVGNFLSTALSTIAGQRAVLDVLVAALLVAAGELISWLVYRRQQLARSLLLSTFNALKIGLIYGMFVEAFKLGS